jgi:hypothetical protein
MADSFDEKYLKNLAPLFGFLWEGSPGPVLTKNDPKLAGKKMRIPIKDYGLR